MKTTLILYMLAIIFILTGASKVMASDFACGSKTISTGDLKFDVYTACGEPSHIERWEKVLIKRDFGPRLLTLDQISDQLPLFVKELVKVEDWEYNLGPNRFIRYLRFENGRLVRITEGDYGY